MIDDYFRNEIYYDIDGNVEKVVLVDNINGDCLKDVYSRNNGKFYCQFDLYGVGEEIKLGNIPLIVRKIFIAETKNGVKKARENGLENFVDM